jgi:hypothetical protein
MRLIAGVVVLAAVSTGVPAAATSADVTRVPRPSFPPALATTAPSGTTRLEIVSIVRRAPTYTPGRDAAPPTGAPRTLSGGSRSIVFDQPGTTFVVYGTGVIAGFGPRGGMKYAFDLRAFGFPPQALVPRAYGPQDVVWARQLGRTLVVQTNHLGYASDSGGLNGYLTGIDLDTGKVRWRSPSLVANARSFVVTRGLIVSGYGFTAEKDWLYLVDPASGRVRDRLALPSMAERITVSGDRIVVRCYDARVVARLVPA